MGSRLVIVTTRGSRNRGDHAAQGSSPVGVTIVKR
jgi:hypothetical protein